MFDIKKEFGTDTQKEIEGVWIDDFGEGLKIKIARIGNPEYQKLFNRISKPHRKAIRRGTLKDETAEKLLIQAMAKGIVLDWKGLSEDGVEIPYSYENALRLLTDYKDFREQVTEVATEIEAFRTEDEEEAEKNFEMSSNGTGESVTS